MTTNCVVCKQPITENQINEEVANGRIHTGECSKYYSEASRTINESGFQAVMKDTELLM